MGRIWNTARNNVKTWCVCGGNTLDICRYQGKCANGSDIPYVYLEVINQAGKVLYEINFTLGGQVVSWNIRIYWNSRLEMWCWEEIQPLAHKLPSSWLIPGSIAHLPFFSNNVNIFPLTSPPQTCSRSWSILQSINSGRRPMQVLEGLWAICLEISGDQTSIAHSMKRKHGIWVSASLSMWTAVKGTRKHKNSDL